MLEPPTRLQSCFRNNGRFGLSVIMIAFHLRPVFSILSVVLSEIVALTTSPIVCFGLFAMCAPERQYWADRVPPFGNSMTTVKKQTGFNRALTPSAELAAVIGNSPQPRTEVTKLLWEYIKARNLQNPANKRNILCDEKLKAVMGKDEVTMFEMSGLVGKHLS